MTILASMQENVDTFSKYRYNGFVQATYSAVCRGESGYDHKVCTALILIVATDCRFCARLSFSFGGLTDGLFVSEGMHEDCPFTQDFTRLAYNVYGVELGLSVSRQLYSGVSSARDNAQRHANRPRDAGNGSVRDLSGKVRNIEP